MRNGDSGPMIEVLEGVRGGTSFKKFLPDFFLSADAWQQLARGFGHYPGSTYSRLQNYLGRV